MANWSRIFSICSSQGQPNMALSQALLKNPAITGFSRSPATQAVRKACSCAANFSPKPGTCVIFSTDAPRSLSSEPKWARRADFLFSPRPGKSSRRLSLIFRERRSAL